MRPFSKLFAIMIVVGVAGNVSAQEYDDMYFTKADRKSKFTNAVYNETSSFKSDEVEPVRISRNEDLTTESYSARTINPDYISKYKSEALDEEADPEAPEEYYVESEDKNKSYSNATANSNYYYNRPNAYSNWNWRFSMGFGYGSPYWGGYYNPYSPWGYGGFYDPFYGYSYYNYYRPYRRWSYWNSWDPWYGSYYSTMVADGAGEAAFIVLPDIMVDTLTIG